MPFNEHGEFSRFRLRRNDVLLNEGQSLALVGRTSRYVDEPPECAFQNSLIRVQAYKHVQPSFLELLFRHSQAAGIFATIATQTTSIAHLGVERLARLVLSVPPLCDQDAIVRFLGYADRRIRRYIGAKKKLVALLNEQKQAIILRAVTRGLDPSVRLKPSGVEWLGDVPAHWAVRPAKHFFREVDERSTTGAEELLSVSHITGITPRSQKNVTMFMAASYVGHKLCRPGDIVINTLWAWMAALGATKYIGIVSPAYGVYRPLGTSQLLSEYADLLLRTRPYVDEYFCRSTGIQSSRLRLYPEQFLSINLICPPEEEQQAILRQVASETVTSNRAIAGAQREIDLLREYRTRLIADVVTGKLDVREAAAHLPDEADASAPLNDADALTEDDDAIPDATSEEEAEG